VKHTQPTREEQLAHALEALTSKLARIPDLTTDARTVLLNIARDGHGVDIYESSGGDTIIWIRQYGPQYEHRWSVSAWNAFVEGKHPSADLNGLCQCKTCQERRWRCATLRFGILEAEKAFEDPETDPNVKEGLPELIAEARAELARLEAELAAMAAGRSS
jgi:hypothetical protein